MATFFADTIGNVEQLCKSKVPSSALFRIVLLILIYKIFLILTGIVHCSSGFIRPLVHLSCEGNSVTEGPSLRPPKKPFKLEMVLTIS